MLVQRDYPDKTSLDKALAAMLAQTIKEAIAAHGQAFIALSGGRTPLGMFTELSLHHLPWEKVTITLVDDRWVDETHPDSNARLLRHTLLQNFTQNVHFISLKNDGKTPYEGQMVCEQMLSLLPEKLDTAVLGMGEDGHTASLFPKAPELEFAFNTHARCAAIDPKTAPHLRMTLTAPYLAQSRKLILHVTGHAKKTLLNNLLADTALGPYAPIRRLFDLAKTEKYVFWAN